MMPSKHQPDFSYLRHVPLRKVHLFTLVQIMCLAVLWILKSTFLAIIFPVRLHVLQSESADPARYDINPTSSLFNTEVLAQYR